MFIGDNSKVVSETSRFEQDVQLVLELQRDELDRRLHVEKIKNRVLAEHGYGGEMESELY